MAEIAHPTLPPESPLKGSSYVGAAVTGTAFGKGHPGLSGSSLPPPPPVIPTPGNNPITPTKDLIGDGVYGTGLNGIHGVSAFDNGVLGENTSNGNGVTGTSSGGDGLHGETTSQTHAGVSGLNNAAFPAVAISGSSANGHGIHGVNSGVSGNGSGSKPTYGCGVWGDSDQGYGVCATSNTHNGLFGSSKGDDGVHGETTSQTHAGVSGLNNAAFPAVAIAGSSANGHGVHGRNQGGAGSGAVPARGCGVWGESDQGYGIYGASVSSSAVYGKSANGLAGEFVGNVTVTGNVAAIDIHSTGTFSGNEIKLSGKVTANDVVLAGLDCAEEFDVTAAEQLQPGTVVVFDGNGAVHPSAEPYNKRVAGVISGAGKYRPGLILGGDGQSGEAKALIALMGRVYCQVDASYSPIEIGDMLTTSATTGFAMKASDPARAFGAVIGKAMASVRSGRELIPILVTLQ